jgi:hypothetical protein
MRVLIALLLSLVAVDGWSQPSAQPAAPLEESAPVATVRAYHQALAAGRPGDVTKLLGPTYFMADEKSGEGPHRLNAHMALAGERLASWPKNYLEQAGPHQNEFVTLAVSMRRDAAVVVTRDTGKNRFRAWKDEETTWLLGNVDGAWRIVGMIIRDIQLPKE